MKTLKRILALLTALVLCLAPMALMVGADYASPAAITGGCNLCGGNTTTYHGIREFQGETLVGSASICSYRTYITEKVVCDSCNELISYNTTTEATSHPTLMPHPANGRYYCSKCGYMQNH